MTKRRSPTMRDVALMAGVSLSTVSNYANGRWQRLSPETRDSIDTAIESLGYRVNSAARSLRSTRTRTIGLLALDDSLRFLADPLTGLYLAGIGDAARESGYSVLVQASRMKSRVDDLMTPIDEHRIDAACVLLSGARAGRRRILQRLDASSVPYAVLDETDTLDVAPRAISVRADQAGGTTALVEHLISNGHRRIAFIAARTPWAVLEQRFDGFKTVLRRHKILVDPDLCLFEGDWTPTSAVPMVRKLLALKSRPTAVVCGSDLLAIGAMRAATDIGFSVPSDLAVAGFDDFDISEQVSPSLTTVRVPAWEMGRTAAELLIARLEDAGKPSASLCLNTTLVIRESA